MEAIDKFTDALAQIENKMKFAHDLKLGYVTSLPKNINEMTIKMKLKVHERMESYQSANNNSSSVMDDEWAGYGGNDYTYDGILKQCRFKWISSKKPEGENVQQYMVKYEWNQIENTIKFGISEQE